MYKHSKILLLILLSHAIFTTNAQTVSTAEGPVKIYHEEALIKVENIINNIFPISGQSSGEIEKLLEYESHPKGESFVSRNKQNEKEYFVLGGICKSYLVDPEGEEITIDFFLENTIISPHSTRTSGNISSYYFKALTDIELATIHASELERLMIENVEIRNFGNTVLQNELKKKIEKEIGLASLSAKERLIEFRKKYKGLENLIPHTDIASYLGITNISSFRSFVGRFVCPDLCC